MTSNLDYSKVSAAILFAASFRFMTLFPFTAALGLAVLSFLALNIAHGEESGHVQTAGAVILVFFVHNLFLM